MKKYSILVLGTTVGIATMLCAGCGGARSSDYEANSTIEVSSTNNTEVSEITYSVKETTESTQYEETTIHIEKTEIDYSVDENSSTSEDIQSEEILTNEAKKILTKKATELYMSGSWDGNEMVLDGHTVKLDENGGCILLDGYCADPTNLDIPRSEYPLTSNSLANYAYVPGDGTYMVLDRKLVKFVRGEKIELTGEELFWKGYTYQELKEKYPDLYLHFTYPKLRYNENDSKLYLFSGDESCLTNNDYYLYVFDNYPSNSYEMHYIGKAMIDSTYDFDVNECIIGF